jgi:hypothetical protein
VEAYVDSGAFYSVFKTGFALAIGIDWQKGEKVYVQAGDGSFIPVYLHTVDIQLRQHRFSGRIGFSEYLGALDRGSVLALMHRFSCQEQRARGQEDADEGLRLGRRPDECQTSA